MRSLLPLLVLLSLIATQPVAAADPIEGAFGMTLGSEFDTSTAIGKNSLTDGTPMYQFAPESPFRSLSSYYVLITPKTRRIYSIWAIGSFPNDESAKKEQAVIMELLTQKYGQGKGDNPFMSFADVKQIDQGDRSVLTKVSGFMDATLDLRYYDDTLRELAEKERLEIEASKADARGL